MSLRLVPEPDPEDRDLSYRVLVTCENCLKPGGELVVPFGVRVRDCITRCEYCGCPDLVVCCFT